MGKSRKIEMSTVEQEADQPEQEAEQSLAELWATIPADSRAVKGVYSVWKDASGGMVIVFRPEGAEEDSHLPIPAPMIAMMMAASEGKGPLARFKAMATARMSG